MANKSNEALQLVSRFSLPPNSLGYCGMETAPQKFSNCIINGICEGVEEEVEKFIVLNPYLETLAQATGKPKFSHEVIECYSFGNSLLNKIENKHYELLLENFIKQGVPDFFVDELREKQPKKFIPTHLFQVLHVGVGKVSGSVPYNIETINNCMVRWGKVEKIDSNQDGEKVSVELNSLEKEGEAFNLIKKRQEISFVRSYVPKIEENSIIAVHWNQVIKVLTPEEVKKLKKWTKKTLEAIN